MMRYVEISLSMYTQTARPHFVVAFVDRDGRRDMWSGFDPDDALRQATILSRDDSVSGGYLVIVDLTMRVLD